jgi:Protein of unknown function (DUF3396)
MKPDADVSAMDPDLQQLPLVLDGKTVVFPCVEIIALSATPKTHGVEGYLRFHEAFDRRYGAHLRHYRLNDSTRWKKLLPKDRRKLAAWFSDTRTLRAPLLGITMHTHDLADEPQPPLFRMFFEHVWPEYPRGMFRMVLPLAAWEDPGALLELADEAMAEFPVYWGSMGFSFYWKSTDTTIDKHAEQWLGRHLVRYPGLAMGNDMLLNAFVEEGIANIGWLTFVGDALIDKLGGRDALSKAVRGTQVGLRSYARGVALQAGPRPELGDVNRRDTLPLYREVGRILEPVFAPNEVLERIQVTGIKDPDRRLAWLRRSLP